MRPLIILLTLLAGAVAVPTSQGAPACTITWDGGGTSDLWIEAANWDLDREPVATDHVCTGPGPTKTGCSVLGATGCIVIEGGETISVKSIQGQRTLYSWGDLSVTDTGGEGLLSRFEQDNGTLRGPGILRVTDFSWGGGTHSGSGMLRADGTTEIYDTVSLTAGRRLQTANGSWSDGSISGASGVVWTITGTFGAQGQGHPLSWNEQLGGVRPQLRVQGTLTVATYDFATRVDWAIDNENLVRVTSGWLRFAGGASENTGRFESADDGELAFIGGTFTMAAGTYDGLKIAGGRLEIPQGGTFTGSGLTTTGSGTVAVAGTLAGSLAMTAGVLTGTGSVTGAVTNTGGIVRPGSSPAGSPGHLTVAGYTQGDAGKLHVDLQGTSYDWLEVTGAASLDGTVEVSLLGGYQPAAGDSFQFLTSASRTGTFDTIASAPGSTAFRLEYPDSAPFGARLHVQPPPAPENTSAPVIEGIAKAGNTVTCQEGTWTSNPTFSYRWLADGTAVTGATSRTFTITAAQAAKQLTCEVTGTNPGGSDTATSAPVSVPPIPPGPPCTITWDGGGGSDLWAVAANWDLDRVPGASDHVCTGLAPTKTNCTALQATGCIVIEGGETVSVKSIQGARTLYLWGDLAVSDSSGEALLSRFEQDGGTLSGPGVLRVTDFAWGGGTHSGSGMLRADGTTQIYDTVSFGAGGRRLQTANGSWSDGSISGASGVVWTITGTFAAQGQGHPLSWTEQPGGVRPQLRVKGTLTVATYDFPTRVDWAIDNENLVRVTSGWLRFAGGASENTGRFESSNAELAFTGGTFKMAAGTYDGLKIAGGRLEIPKGGTFTGSGLTSTGGTVAVAGTLAGSLVLTGGGVLTGSGSVTGAVTNTSGIVRPGSSPGQLTVGSYTQGAAGKLHIELAGTAPGTTYDQLEVTGAAALDGTVEVSLLGGFDPPFSDSFQFLTSASRTGTFDDPPVYSPMPSGKTFRLDYPQNPFGARLLVYPPAAPENTSAPVIEGIAKAGDTVTCQEGAWTNDPTFTYRWLADGTAIGGATSRTFTITAAQVAKQLTCEVTGTNLGGSDTATSAPVSVPPIQVAPANATPPAVTGTPSVGKALTCTPGSWTGAPAPTLAYQWLRDGEPVVGATGLAYTVVHDDLGKTLTCRETATNAAGSAAATSAGLAIPVPDAVATPTPTPTPAPTAAPTPAPTVVPPPTAEEKLVAATPSRVATAFGLRSARRCVNRRNFTIRLRPPRGVKVERAIVTVGTKRPRVRKVGRHFVATVDLRELPKGRFTVRIRILTTSGRTILGSRRYRTCAPAV